MFVILLCYQCFDISGYNSSERAISKASSVTNPSDIYDGFFVRGCVFKRSTTFKGIGGVIYIQYYNFELNIDSCVFENCSSSVSGGCVFFYCIEKGISVSKTHFSDCFSNTSSVLYVSTKAQNQVSSSSFDQNIYQSSYCIHQDDGSFQSNYNNFSRNSGCFKCEILKSFDMKYCVFNSNDCNNEYCICLSLSDYSKFHLSDSQFTNNRGTSIYVSSIVLFVSRCSFVDNSNPVITTLVDSYSTGLIMSSENVFDDCVINGTIYYEPILTTYIRVLFFLILPNLICFVVTRFMESKPPIVSLVHCLCVNIYFSLIITLNLRKFYYDLLAIKFLFTYTVDGTDGVFLTIHFYSMTTMFIFIVIAFSMIGFVIINFFIYHLSNYYYEQNINNCCMDPICNLLHHPCCDPPNDVYGVFNEINKNYISINSLMNEISKIQQHYPVIKVKQTPKKNRYNINESGQDISVFIQYGSWEETEDCPMIPNKSIIHYKCEIDCEFDDVLQQRINSSINTLKNTIEKADDYSFSPDIIIPSFRRELFASRGICFHYRVGILLYMVLLVFGYSYIFNAFWRFNIRNVNHRYKKKVSHKQSLKSAFFQMAWYENHGEET